MCLQTISKLNDEWDKEVLHRKSLSKHSPSGKKQEIIFCIGMFGSKIFIKYIASEIIHIKMILSCKIILY